MTNYSRKDYVFGGIRVAHLFSFLFCVFGGIRVAHFLSFLFCVFGGIRVTHHFKKDEQHGSHQKHNPFLSSLSYSFLSSTTILNCDNDYLGGKFVDKK
jgi:hypothetical protein